METISNDPRCLDTAVSNVVARMGRPNEQSQAPDEDSYAAEPEAKFDCFDYTPAPDPTPDFDYTPAPDPTPDFDYTPAPDPTPDDRVPAGAAVNLTPHDPSLGKPHPYLSPAASEERIAANLCRSHGDEFRYVAEWKAWFIFDGAAWKRDTTNYVYNVIRGACRAEALAAPAKLKRFIASARTASGVQRLLESDRQFAATPDQWDADPWLLNTPNGIVDLKAGTIRPLTSSDLMTKLTTVGPGGDCPRFKRFLEQTMMGNQRLISYMLRVLGYSLTGLTREQAFFFHYGMGGNGKSALLNTVMHIMGDYGRSASMDTFTESKSERHPTELAMLRGARVVLAVETSEGKAWDEAKIKQLTGGDAIVARFMRQDYFEFVPQFKLHFVGNHRPDIRVVDPAIRRRPHLISYDFAVDAASRDADLPDILKSEASGILSLMIQGCLDWQKFGLSPPAEIVQATQTYLDNEDVLGSWLNDRCERDPAAWTTVADLYEDFTSACETDGERAASKRRFSQLVEGAGFRPERRHSGRGFAAIRLVDAPLVLKKPFRLSKANSY